MPIHARFGRVYGSQNKGKLFAVLSLFDCSKLGLTSFESNSIKISSTIWSPEMSKI